MASVFGHKFRINALASVIALHTLKVLATCDIESFARAPHVNENDCREELEKPILFEEVLNKAKIDT